MKKPLVTREDNGVGLLRSVWCALAIDGGWLTAPAIKELVPPEIAVEQIHNALWAAAHRHGVLEFRHRELRNGRKVTEYAVTKDCMVPRFLIVSDVMEVLWDRFVEEYEERRRKARAVGSGAPLADGRGRLRG